MYNSRLIKQISNMMDFHITTKKSLYRKISNHKRKFIIH